MLSVGGPGKILYQEPAQVSLMCHPLASPGGRTEQRGRLVETVGDCGWRTSISSGSFLLPTFVCPQMWDWKPTRIAQGKLAALKVSGGTLLCPHGGTSVITSSLNISFVRTRTSIYLAIRKEEPESSFSYSRHVSHRPGPGKWGADRSHGVGAGPISLLHHPPYCMADIKVRPTLTEHQAPAQIKPRPEQLQGG